MGSIRRGHHCPKIRPGSRRAVVTQALLRYIRSRIRLGCTHRCTRRRALPDTWSDRCSCSGRRPGRPRRPAPHYTAEGRHRRSSRAMCMPVAPHRCSPRPPSLPRRRPLGSPRPPGRPARPRPDSSTTRSCYPPRPPRARNPAPRPARRPDGVHEAGKSWRVAAQVSDQYSRSETAAKRRASVGQPVTFLRASVVAMYLSRRASRRTGPSSLTDGPVVATHAPVSASTAHAR